MPYIVFAHKSSVYIHRGFHFCSAVPKSFPAWRVCILEIIIIVYRAACKIYIWMHQKTIFLFKSRDESLAARLFAKHFAKTETLFWRNLRGTQARIACRFTCIARRRGRQLSTSFKFCVTHKATHAPATFHVNHLKSE